MTLQPTANRNDVRFDSPQFGVRANFMAGMPSEYSSLVTGGGSVNAGNQQFGVEVDPGTTSGDTAEVTREGQNRSHMDWRGDMIVIDRFWLSREDDGDIGNTLQAGFISPGNDGESAYWDANAGQFQAGGTTVSAPTISSNAYFLEIVHDSNADTTFRVYQAGSLQAEETINDGHQRANDLFYTESDGSNDRLWCPMHTSAWIPKGLLGAGE